MLLQTTNQFAHYRVPVWSTIQKLVRQFTGTSTNDVSMLDEMSALSIHQNHQNVSTQSVSTQGAAQPTRSTKRTVPLTNAEIEALELAIRQGSVNAPSI